MSRKASAIPEETVEIPRSVADRLLAMLDGGNAPQKTESQKTAGTVLKASGWTITAGSRPKAKAGSTKQAFVIKMDGHGRSYELVPSTAEMIASIVRPNDAGLADALTRAAKAKPVKASSVARDLPFTPATF